MPSAYRDCTSISDQCPVSATTYGYIPDLPSNTILAIIFGLCTLAQAFFALRFRIWGFGFAVTVGCLGECLGYIGRVQMHENVWNSNAFQIQLITLILAPSFLAAGIYLTLKHMVMGFGTQYSRLRPVLYVWIFVGGDVASIVLQGFGAGRAVTADDPDGISSGNDMIIAGLVAQVCVMVICLLLALDFGFNVYKGRTVRKQVKEEWKLKVSPQKGRNFIMYLSCTGLAFLTILIRSIYRVPEFAGGWGGEMMREELDFMLLDGMMIAIAAIAMTVGHPGIFFPAMSSKYRKLASEDQEMASRSLQEEQRTSSGYNFEDDNMPPRYTGEENELPIRPMREDFRSYEDRRGF